MTTTQADRDAVNAFHSASFTALFDDGGEINKAYTLLLEAFARHREAAEARAREDIEAKLRNVISHATGGSLQDTTLPLNEIAVRISAFRTRLWNDALAKGREEGAKAMQEAVSEWLRADAEQTEREATRIVADTTGDPRKNAAEWALLVSLKRGIATAIAALDPAQIAGGKP